MQLLPRPVSASEVARLRELRLAALRSDPAAFGSTYAEEANAGSDYWDGWAQRSDQGADQRTFVLADGEDRWWGLALVRRADDDPALAHLLSMWVHPAARRRGGARMLCTACLDWARDHSIATVSLDVEVGNEPARRAYEAAGFVVARRSAWTGAVRTMEVLVMTRLV